MLLVEREPGPLIDAMHAWRAPPTPQYLTRAQT